MTISVSPDEEYRYNDGVVSVTFRCDGKFRPIGNNRTQKCVQSSPTTLDQTVMQNAVMTNTYRWELSDRGRVFTSTAIAFRPDGAIVRHQLVASRLTGSDGFAGQWQDTSVFQNYSGRILRIDGQYLHIGSLGADQSIDVPLNGAEATTHGDNGLTARKYTLQRVGPRELLLLGKLNGKAVSEESLTLGDDGGVIIGSWWNPSRPTDKARLVYEKR